MSVSAHERAVDGLRLEEGGTLLSSFGVREGVVKVWDTRSLRRPLVAVAAGPGLRDACLRGNRLAVAAAERATVWTLWGAFDPDNGAEEGGGNGEAAAAEEGEAASLEALSADKKVRRHAGRQHLAGVCWNAESDQLALLQAGGALDAWAVGRDPVVGWAPGGELACVWPHAKGVALRSAPEDTMHRRATRGYALDARANAALVQAEGDNALCALWQLVGGGAARHSGAAGLLAGLDSGTYHLGALQLWGGSQREAVLELVRPTLEVREQAALLALQGRVADAITQLQAAGHEALGALLAGLDAQGGSVAWRAALLRVREVGLLGAALRVMGGTEWQEASRSLPLSRRLCLALLLLNDLALVQWIASTTTEEIAQGSVEVLLLTGLQKAALPALQAYLDRTSDLQTCALVVAGLVPSRFRDATAERWVESYRALLDRWGLARLRATLDVARRGPQQEDEGGAAALRLGVSAAASQIYIRCNNCDQSLALAMMVPSKMSLRTAGLKTGHAVTRVKSCPSPKCRETLPRCVLCLLPVECTAPLGQVTQADSVLLQDNYFSFCTLCRHGGHAEHMLAWFASNDACPVSGCECVCNA